MRSTDDNQMSRAAQSEDVPAAFVSRKMAWPGQLTLTDLVDDSQHQTAQRRFTESVDGSPRQLAQHQRTGIVTRPNDTGLPDNLKAGIEQLSGISMDEIKVHYNSPQPAQMHAHAYAQGNQIHVAPGQEKHLPHEAWHLVQQAQGRVKPTLQLKGVVPVNDDAELEAEADFMGAKAIEIRAEYQAHQGASPQLTRQMAWSADHIVRHAVTRAERSAKETAVETRRHHTIDSSRTGVVQRVLAVAMHTVAVANVTTTRIGTIDIVGRPDHETFPIPGGGATEGDHATAWSVMRLAVTNRLRNQFLHDAFATLNTLVTEAKALPGAQANRLTAVNQTRRNIVTNADGACDAAAAQAATAIAADNVNLLISALQRYIHAYLTYRNSIGLTVLNREATASGDGEPAPLRFLQYWETSWTDNNAPSPADQTRLQSAMGAMFSPTVAAEGGTNADRLPGQLQGETKAQIDVAMATQHRASIVSAFPNLNNRMPAAVVTPGQAWAGGEIPPGAPGVVTGAYVAIQITLADNGTIENITTAGRSEHGMGGSEGSHTTSYALFARAIRRLRGQTPTQAVAILNTVIENFRAMPGAELNRAAEMPPARQVLFAEATALMDAAVEAGAAAPNLSAVQCLASAALFFRNTMGLTTAHLGNVPDNHAEQIHLQTLDEFEQRLAAPHGAPLDRAILVNAISRLFDNSTLRNFHVENEDDQLDDDRNAETPGRLSNETLDSAFAALLKQHILTLNAAYPRIFALIDPALLSAIATHMHGDYVVALPVAIDYLDPNPQSNLVSAAPQVAPAPLSGKRKGGGAQPASKSRRHNDDDDDYLPPLTG